MARRRRSRAQIFRPILLPGALPFVVVGLRLGATIGLINTVVAELYTAVSGLGGLLASTATPSRWRPTSSWLALALIGMTVAQALRLARGPLDRWRYNGGSKPASRASRPVHGG